MEGGRGRGYNRTSTPNRQYNQHKGQGGAAGERYRQDRGKAMERGNWGGQGSSMHVGQGEVKERSREGQVGQGKVGLQ